MRLSAAIHDYHYAIAQLSPKTQRWYKEKLAAFERWCDLEGVLELEDLTPTTIRRYLAHLREDSPSGKTLSSYTLHGYTQVIKVFLHWCVQDRLISESPGDRVRMPKVEVKVIHTYTPQHVRALFAAARHTRFPERDKAMLMTLLDTGIRAEELCELRLANAHLDPNGGYLRVLGKGRKEREVPISATASLAIRKYLRVRAAPASQQRVFVARAGRTLTPDGLLMWCHRLNARAGIESIRVSPHTFRHTFALTFLREGGDIYRLSKLLGHSSVTVTEHYLRDFRAEDARTTGISVLEALSR